MSDAPTSAVDRLDLKAALTAGWTAADIEWEAKQEQAALLAQEDKIHGALALWRETLGLARAHFQKNDPRLGTSLANLGYGLRHQGDRDAAKPLFQEAKRCWDASWSWIDQLHVTPRARSSLYHLRMELRHRDQYEANARKRFHAFAEEARTAVAALAEGGTASPKGLARWRGEKPPTFIDQRKLLAACLLLITKD